MGLQGPLGSAAGRSARYRIPSSQTLSTFLGADSRDGGSASRQPSQPRVLPRAAPHAREPWTTARCAAGPRGRGPLFGCRPHAEREEQAAGGNEWPKHSQATASNAMPSSSFILLRLTADARRSSGWPSIPGRALRPPDSERGGGGGLEALPRPRARASWRGPRACSAFAPPHSAGAVRRPQRAPWRMRERKRGRRGGRCAPDPGTSATRAVAGLVCATFGQVFGVLYPLTLKVTCSPDFFS